MDKLLKPDKLSTDPNSPNAVDDWRYWIVLFNNFLEAVDSNDDMKLKLLISLLSPSIFKLVSGCTSFDEALNKLTQLYDKPKNVIFARHLLATHKQKADESIDQFLQNLYNLAQDCDIKAVSLEQNHNDLIRDAFVTGLCSTQIRQRLLENSDASLSAAVAQARALSLAQQNSDLYSSNETTSIGVNAIETGRVSPNPSIVSTPHNLAISRQMTCYFSGNQRHARSYCPARDAVCHKCQRRGHLSKVCRSKSSRSDNHSNAIVLANLTSSTTELLSKSTVRVNIMGHLFTALIDSGSTDNFIKRSVAQNLRLKITSHTCSITLASSNKSVVNGICSINLNLDNNRYSNVKFLVLETLCCDVILGHSFLCLHNSVSIKFNGPRADLSICNLAAMNVESPSLFTNLDPSCRPIAIPSRRMSADDKTFIAEEIKRMLSEGIIEPSNSPWRAQVLVTRNSNHKKSDDLAYYDAIEETIACIGLARPLNSFLHQHVRFLLCIATAVDITLLGVIFQPTNRSNVESSRQTLHLLSDPLFSLATDNYLITCFRSTDDGRLFFGTREGHLLELKYNRIDSWDLDDFNLPQPSKMGSCSLINHSASPLSFILPSVLTSGFFKQDPICQMTIDSHRSVLYTRSEKSSITAYSFSSTPGESVKQIAHAYASDLGSIASSVIQSVDRDQFTNFASIDTISSDQCHLMVTTTTGVRLYLDDQLQLLHVRLSPTNAAGTHQHANAGLGNVKLVAETRGTVVMATEPSSTSTLRGGNVSQLARSSNDESPFSVPPSLVYTVSPDPYPWTPNLTELCSSVWCSGGAWTLAVLPSDRHQPSDSPMLRNGGRTGLGSCRIPPIVLTQHFDPPCRRILLVSACGLVHLSVPTPMHQLKTTLARSNLDSLRLDGLTDTSSDSFLSSFLQLYSPDEAICCALAVGALDPSLGQTVERAIYYFAAHAGQLWTPPIDLPPPIVTTPIPATPGNHQEALDASMAASLFLFSGLTLFLARLGQAFLLDPLFEHRSSSALMAVAGGKRNWMRSLVETLVGGGGSVAAAANGDANRKSFISRLDRSDLAFLSQQLAYVQRFLRRQLDERDGWFKGVAPGHQQQSQQNAWRLQLQALAQQLDHLLTLQLELFGLWQIVADHCVDDIFASLTEDERYCFLTCPFDWYLSSLTNKLSPPVGFSQQPKLPTAAGYRAPSSPFLYQQHHPQPLAGADLLASLMNALITAYLDELVVSSSTAKSANRRQDEDDESPLTGASAVSVEVITNRLQASCPTLFAQEDALCAKAGELLVQATLLSSTLDLQSSSSSLATSDLLGEIDQLVSHALDLYDQAGPDLDLTSAVHRLESCGAWRAALSLSLNCARKRDPLGIAVECVKTGRQPSSSQSIPTTGQTATGKSELAAVDGRYEAYRCMTATCDRLFSIIQLPATTTDIWSHPVSSSSSSDTPSTASLDQKSPICAAKLNTESARSILQSLLDDVVNSDDVLAHFELFNWLWMRNLFDTAISLRSPHFEAYLRSRLRQLPEHGQLRCMLWRELERREAKIEAAHVLEHLAVAPCPEIDLKDRLGYLARAIVLVKSLPDKKQDYVYLQELEAQLELAQLQKSLHDELVRRSSNGTSSQACGDSLVTTSSKHQLVEAANQLATGPLLSPTELFTDYADKFGLHESKLCILWTTGSQDAELFKAIWQDLMTDVLSRPSPGNVPQSPSRNRDWFSADRVAIRLVEPQLAQLSLTDLFKAIGKKLVDTGDQSSRRKLFLPLPEILIMLEYYACQQSLPSSWTAGLFLNARLTSYVAADLVEAYESLLHCKDVFWRKAGTRQRLYDALLTVVDDFVSLVNNRQSRHYSWIPSEAARLVDSLTSNLVDLSADSALDVGHRTSRSQLSDRMRRLHHQLQQIGR